MKELCLVLLFAPDISTDLTNKVRRGCNLLGFVPHTPNLPR